MVTIGGQRRRGTWLAAVALAFGGAVVVAPPAAMALDCTTRTDSPPGRYLAVREAYIGNTVSGYTLGYMWGPGEAPGNPGYNFIAIQKSGWKAEGGVCVEYGYGRISNSSFGGWGTSGTCGWVRLSSLVPDGTPTAPTTNLCPTNSQTDGGLASDRLFRLGTYRDGCGEGCVQPAVMTQSCYSWGNYNSSTQQFSNRYGILAAGRGTAGYPGVTTAVVGFGTRYVTKDGRAVLVKDSSGANNVAGYENAPRWTFVDRSCIQGERIGWSGTVQYHGGPIVGAPAVASWGPGRLDVFARGTDNSLMHKWFDNGVWSGWESLGGTLNASPAAVSWGPNRLDVFVRSVDNALWHIYFDGRWSAWERFGGTLASGPAAASWSSGRIDVFVRGTDNALWHMWFDGRWSAWESLGGTITSAPAAVSWGPNRIDIFARSSSGHLAQLYFANAWGPWQVHDLGSATIGSSYGPAVTATGVDKVDVHYTSWDARLYQKSWRWGANVDSPGWEIPHRLLDRTLTSSPGAETWSSMRTDVFFRGSDNYLYQTWRDG